MDAVRVVDFLEIVGRLKTTKRTGWLHHSIDLPESIADHMHRGSVAALLLAGGMDASVNAQHVSAIMGVHDVAEAIAGDITPLDGVSKQDKEAMEEDAMQQMKDVLGDNPAGQRIYALWREYEDAATPEAKAAKDIDKFEMVLQALEYERAQGVDLTEFFTCVQGRVHSSTVQAWVDEVVRRRPTPQQLQSTRDMLSAKRGRARCTRDWTWFGAGVGSGVLLACGAALLLKWLTFD